MSARAARLKKYTAARSRLRPSSKRASPSSSSSHLSSLLLARTAELSAASLALSQSRSSHSACEREVRRLGEEAAEREKREEREMAGLRRVVEEKRRETDELRREVEKLKRERTSSSSPSSSSPSSSSSALASSTSSPSLRSILSSTSIKLRAHSTSRGEVDAEDVVIQASAVLLAARKIIVQRAARTVLCLNNLPTVLLSTILSFAENLRGLLSLGRVSRHFLAASRSPHLFTHVDFLSSGRRPVDCLLAAARGRAQPELVRVRTERASFKVLHYCLERLDLSRLSFLELFASCNHRYRPARPLLNTATRDGSQMVPLTPAGWSVYNDATMTLSNFDETTPACTFLSSVCGDAGSAVGSLHLRIDTYVGSHLLSSLKNLTKLTLVCPQDALLNIESLASLTDLELIGFTGKRYLGLGSGTSTVLSALSSPSLRILNLERAGKSFNIAAINCPELRLITCTSGLYGCSFGPETIQNVYNCTYGSFRARDGVWGRGAYSGAGYPYWEMEDWKLHEDCVIRGDGNNEE